MNRRNMMIAALVVLGGISVFIWTTREKTEVDPTFAEIKQNYNCPHCDGSFELTGSQAAEMIAAGGDHGGIICSLCGKDIDNFTSAMRAPNTAVDDGNDVDEEEPVTAVGSRSKRGG